MELTERVHVVGSDDLGFGLSHQFDCCVDAANGRTGIALIDAASVSTWSGSIVICVPTALT